jgi:hypothetical protein
MGDASIHQQINDLVRREHELRENLAHSGSDEVRSALREVEETLDQCWDLLRQREGRRDAGEDPEQARVRPVTEVEGYLQ